MCKLALELRAPPVGIRVCVSVNRGGEPTVVFAIGLDVGAHAIWTDLDLAADGPLVDGGHTNGPVVGTQGVDGADGDELGHG